ncbi:hypothetical protein [Anatilimnocola floriformis]|uniref:hypothetical protein n=1 Tax=Anatilimnocola floriformis TaxID=2948575 RepID=UPI0020C31E33|nr:hypothetical protein [Anatilimnocola floriformis]
MTQAREVAPQPISPLRGWGSACAIFVTVVLVALAATCGIAWQMGGQRFLPSALTAWALVWGAALISLVMVFLGKQIGQGLGFVLLGMGVRMGLPLMAAMFLDSQSPVWGETKLMLFLLGNYFVALVAETGLAVQLLGSNSVSGLAKPAASTDAPSKA